MLIALNKPFQVMSQFSPSAGRKTLSDFLDLPSIYPAGRLDYDSEGLLLLTDEGGLQHALSSPASKVFKRYWVQLEGQADEAALAALRQGVMIQGRKTLPARARHLSKATGLWPREPPIRYRAQRPTSWIELAIAEGRNRQVRRMTAAIGLPTLRLIRVAIGDIDLLRLQLAPGQWCEVSHPIAPHRVLQKRTWHANGKSTGSA